MSDFGDLSFLSDYQRVADLPFYKSLTFSNLGLIIAQGELEMVLKRRLQLVDYLNRFPSVSSVPIRSPVFVFGLGRSGTTFLHRLLSLDPSARAPLLWELVNPVPSVDGDAASDVMKADCDMRAKAIKDKLATRSILGDKTLENLHEIGYNLPEECLFSLADEIPFSFHYVYTCLLHLHQFRELIPSQRLLQAYYSHKKILQLLSYQTEGERDSPKRWVLKFPLHIFFLHELCAVFPDAKLIWAHRHPATCLSSVCSLLKGFHELYYESPCCNKRFIGQSMLEVTSKILLQAPRDLAELNATCAHVLYDNLVNDPIGTVKMVYNTHGWEFTAKYEAILQQYLLEDKLKRDDVKRRLGLKHAIHEHDLSEFGLTDDILSTGPYAEYMKMFNMEQCKL